MLNDVGLLILRVSTGVTLMAHGYPKLFGGPGKQPPEPMIDALGKNYGAEFEKSGPDAFAGSLERMDVPMPRAAAYAAGMAELGGGLGLVLGLNTRVSALAVLIEMSVAIRKAHWETGFYGQGGYEHAFALWSSALGLLCTGPGRISLDTLIGVEKTRKRSKAEKAAREAEEATQRQRRTLDEAKGRGMELLGEALLIAAQEARRRHGVSLEEAMNRGAEVIEGTQVRGRHAVREARRRGSRVGEEAQSRAGDAMGRGVALLEDAQGRGRQAVEEAQVRGRDVIETTQRRGRGAMDEAQSRTDDAKDAATGIFGRARHALQARVA